MRHGVGPFLKRLLDVEIRPTSDFGRINALVAGGPDRPENRGRTFS